MLPQFGLKCSAMDISKILDTLFDSIYFGKNKNILQTVLSGSTEVTLSVSVCDPLNDEFVMYGVVNKLCLLKYDSSLLYLL